MPTDQLTAHKKDNLGSAVVIVLFFVSRLIAYFLGVRFDASTLPCFWQIVDLTLLQSDLARSLWYLHSQPPLFNLFLGLVLKVAGDFSPFVFQTIYLLIGLATTVMLYRLLLRLGAGVPLSIAITTLFIASPGALLYENLLFYTWPTLALLVASALWLHRFASSGKTFDGATFFILLAALVFMRSLFHLVWFLGSTALLLLLLRRLWRKILFTALVPFLLIVGLHAKNLVLFGDFADSSWLGLSLAKVVLFNMPIEQREHLAFYGVTSVLVQVPPYSKLEDFPLRFRETKPTGIPILDRAHKASGWPNFHHLAYYRISKQYLNDTLRIVRLHPEIYLRALGLGWEYWLNPPSDLAALKDNRGRLGAYVDVYNSFVYGEGAFVALLWPAALLFVLIYTGRRMHLVVADRARFVTLLFMAYCALFAAVVGNAIECGENFRFRFLLEPYWFAFAGLALAYWRAKVAKKN